MHKTPLRSIREHCLWCCKNSNQEVAQCFTTKCPLYPARFGRGVKGKGYRLLKIIRQKCLDCSGFEIQRVKFCVFNGQKNKECVLSRYRMGRRNARIGLESQKPLPTMGFGVENEKIGV